MSSLLGLSLVCCGLCLATGKLTLGLSLGVFTRGQSDTLGGLVCAWHSRGNPSALVNGTLSPQSP